MMIDWSNSGASAELAFTTVAVAVPPIRIIPPPTTATVRAFEPQLEHAMRSSGSVLGG
jgi:hypothetical protein